MERAQNSDSETHVEMLDWTFGSDLSGKALCCIFLGHPVAREASESQGCAKVFIVICNAYDDEVDDEVNDEVDDEVDADANDEVRSIDPGAAAAKVEWEI